MGRLRKHLTYANVVSSLALFVALSGGVAFAALAVNSVGPKQIQKNAVRSSEIKSDAVGKSEIKRDAVRSPDVRNHSILGIDIAQQTLALNPVGGADNDGQCDPNVNLPGIADILTCAEVTYDFPHAGPALIVAQASWFTSGDTAPSEGLCQMTVDDLAVGQSMFIGELGPTEDTDQQHTRTAAGTAITDTLPAGSHHFELVCSEEDSNIDINQAAISTVALGTG